MKNTQKVTQEWVNKIEALQYEVNARRELMMHMIEGGVDPESAGYVRYHREYLEFFKKLEQAKEEFAEEYIYPQTNGERVPWNLDFKTQTVSF